MSIAQINNLTQMFIPARNTIASAADSIMDIESSKISIDDDFADLLKDDLTDDDKKNEKTDNQTRVQEELLAMMSLIAGWTPQQAQETAKKFSEVLIQLLRQGRRDQAINVLQQLSQIKTQEDAQALIEQTISGLAQAPNQAVEKNQTAVFLKIADTAQNSQTIDQAVVLPNISSEEKIVKLLEKVIEQSDQDKLPKQEVILKTLVDAQTGPNSKQIVEKFVSAAGKITLDVSLPPANTPQTQMNTEQIQSRVEMINLIKDAVNRMEIRQAASTWQSNIELKHQVLGTTRLNMELIEDNKVKIEIIVGKNESRDILNNSFSDLKHIFEDKGLFLSSCNVDVDSNLGSQFFTKNMFNEFTQTSPQDAPERENIATTGEITTAAQYRQEYLEADKVNCKA